MEKQRNTDFETSDIGKQYQEQAAQRKDILDKAIVGKTNQDEYRRRGEIDGAAIDRQHQLATAANRMEVENRKMAISAAMQSPVRSGLEDSYRMVSDELMRTGEAQRLGGSLGEDSEFGKAVSEHLMPVLEDNACQANTLIVTISHSILRCSIPLFSGFFIPFYRCSMILLYICTFIVGFSK